MMGILGILQQTWNQNGAERERNNQQAAGNIQALLCALKSCSTTQNLIMGRQNHAEAIESGHHRNIYVANALVNMYAKCGSMVDAHEVFDGIKHLTVVSWTALILGYANNGQGYLALGLFSKMGAEGPAIDSITLVAALKSCTALAVKEGATLLAKCRDIGKEIHNIVVGNGYSTDVYVQNSLIRMYVKCRSMLDAHKVFDDMKCPDAVSWTALIMGHVENGEGDIALDMFTRMVTEGPAPDSVTLVAALRACTSLEEWAECREWGKKIHTIAVKSGCNRDLYVQNSLIDMYAKSGDLAEARDLFDGMQHPDVVSWTALIMGCADNGQGHLALDLFTRMTVEGPAHNSVTFVAALKACTSIAVEAGDSQSNDRGIAMHNLAVENDFHLNIYVQSTLVDMYVKCGSMEDAREVFNSMNHPDVVSWTALISGYADSGQGRDALHIFSRMRCEGPALNYVTVLAALKACTSLEVAECRDGGKEIHNIVVGDGFNSDLCVNNSLINMYTNCSSILDAREVFDNMKHPDAVSWTALILGYAENGQGHIALEMFTRMGTEGPAPDSITIVVALKACTSLAVKSGWAECRARGQGIHNVAVESGCDSDVYVQSTLVDMYAKCVSLVDAHQVFDNMKDPDLVSWTALIWGYAEKGQGRTALDLFTRMRTEGPAPDYVTFGAALKACGLVGALDFGRIIHSELDNGNELDVVLVNCLVDFYAKCGSLVEAQNVFDSHAQTRDIITWNALLAGFSTCGDIEAVFGMFQAMQDACFMPDDITFCCVLTCCSHAGLVLKGKECFDSMSTKYGISPNVKHYTCMIDLFGRANKLDNAVALLERMPCSPDKVTWMTLLGACRKWKNVQIGRLAFQSLVDLNDADAAPYVLMGQLYGSKGMLQEQEVVLGLQKKLKFDKTPGEEACWTNESSS